MFNENRKNILIDATDKEIEKWIREIVMVVIDEIKLYGKKNAIKRDNVLKVARN